MSMSSGMNSSGVRLAAIGEAWTVVQKNMGTWIVTSLIYVVLVGVVSAVIGKIGGDSSILRIILSLVTAAVAGFLMGGALRMAFKQLRGEATSPADIFNAGDLASYTVGASVVQQIALLIGFALCVIPGLLLAPLVILTLPLAVEQRTGAVDSLMRSINTLKPHWGSAFVLSLVLGVILILSLIPCGLGILVTWPLLVVTSAIVYNDFFGGSPAVADNSNLYPPIPNIPQ